MEIKFLYKMNFKIKYQEEKDLCSLTISNLPVWRVFILEHEIGFGFNLGKVLHRNFGSSHL